MKKIIFFIFATLFITSCSEQISDPTRQKDAYKAKKVRQEHSKKFGGNF